jgi:hypothetical protein
MNESVESPHHEVNDAKAAFLGSHEEEIGSFLRTVQGAVDHATSERKNDGQLWQHGHAMNVHGSTWNTTFPELPPHLKEFSTFSTGAPVDVEARYLYGSDQSTIGFQITPAGTDDYENGFYVTFAVDPKTGKVAEHPWSVHKAGGYDDQTEVSEEDVLTIMDNVFSDNEDYKKGNEPLTIGDAFKLGVTTQPEYGADSSTVEYGMKGVGTSARSQLNLEVSVENGSHPQEKPCRTSIRLKRNFGPGDYPDGIYGGYLEQVLTITQDPHGKVTDAKRASAIYLADEPMVVMSGDKEQIVSARNKAEPADLPKELAEKLYPTPVPDRADLDYFKQLITTPIYERDLLI